MTDVVGTDGMPSRDSLQPVTAITIPTRRRQESLTRLLRALADDYGARTDVWVVVVDNDPDGSSQEVVDAVGPQFSGSVVYRIEPEEGYANVRNAAVAAAAGCDYIAFIDDDEIPEPGWLDALYDAQRRFGADIVAGAVITDFPPATPAWFKRSGVIGSEVPKLATGTTMQWCATSNTLVAYRVFGSISDGFDPRFNVTSGEDTHFFARAHIAGFRIVWTNESRVRELVPLTRTHTMWILRRAARTGANKALIETEVMRSPYLIATRVAKATAMLMIGAVTAVVGVARRDRGVLLRGLQRCAEGAGTFVGFFGVPL
jgi:succinoglycan biosynthesis protein ExoM